MYKPKRTAKHIRHPNVGYVKLNDMITEQSDRTNKLSMLTESVCKEHSFIHPAAPHTTCAAFTPHRGRERGTKF